MDNVLLNSDALSRKSETLVSAPRQVAGFNANVAQHNIKRCPFQTSGINICHLSLIANILFPIYRFEKIENGLKLGSSAEQVGVSVYEHNPSSPKATGWCKVTENNLSDN